MTTTDGDRPPAVAVADAEEIIEESGVEPTLERISATRWRLTVSTERVHATAVYKAAATAFGRATHIDGTLIVDGKERVPATSAKHLGEIIVHPGGPDDPVLPDPVPTGGNPAAAPPILLHMRGIVLHKLATREPSASVSLGYDEERRTWVLGLDRERGSFRFYFRRTKSQWMLDMKRPFQVIIDGVERTYEAGGKIEKMMELLAGSIGDQPGPPTTMGRAADAKANNGLTVRKTTVIRV